MGMRRRFIAANSSGVLLAAFGTPANAQAHGQAKILVGFPPGGTPDAVAQQVAEQLTNAYARTVIVIRSGSGSTRRPGGSSSSSAVAAMR